MNDGKPQQLILPGMEGLNARCSCPIIWDLWVGESYTLHISQSCRKEGYR